MSKSKDVLSVTPLDGAKLALGMAKILVKASPIPQVSILVDTAELILNIVEVRMAFASLPTPLHLATLIMIGVMIAHGALNFLASKVKHRSARRVGRGCLHFSEGCAGNFEEG